MYKQSNVLLIQVADDAARMALMTSLELGGAEVVATACPISTLYALQRFAFTAAAILVVLPADLSIELEKALYRLRSRGMKVIFLNPLQSGKMHQLEIMKLIDPAAHLP